MPKILMKSGMSLTEFIHTQTTYIDKIIFKNLNI